jgi:hypothetical protein
MINKQNNTIILNNQIYVIKINKNNQIYKCNWD